MNEQDFDDAFNAQAEPDDITNTDPVEQTVQVEEAPVETVETTVDSVADDLDEEAKRVPLAALIDTRMKLREAERAREERERELQQLREAYAASQAPQQAPSFPDPYDDPQGYAAYTQQQIQQAVLAERWNNSNLSAIAAHGDEAVAAARNWAAQHARSDPAFEQQAMAQHNPIDWLVKQHKRHARLAEFETDEEAFIRRRAAEMGLISASPAAEMQQAQATQAARKAAPPVSLATVSSQRAHGTGTGKDVDFDDAFRFRR